MAIVRASMTVIVDALANEASLLIDEEPVMAVALSDAAKGGSLGFLRLR